MAENIRVDQRACNACGACVDVCTTRVFKLSREHCEASAPERCWGCGHCVAVCPEDAIDHPAFPLEQCPLPDSAGGSATEALVRAFRDRRSIRAFEARPVERDLIRSLLGAGRWAPTATNRQPVDWLVLDDPVRIRAVAQATAEELARFGRWLRLAPVRAAMRLRYPREIVRQARENADRLVWFQEEIDAGRDPVLYHAPALLVAHTPGRSPFDRDDTAYAAYNVMLAAASEGLGTCQIGLLQLVLERRARVRRLIGLPRARTSHAALVLGYPAWVFRRQLPRRLPDVNWNPE
ncbi:MAG: nitroreductase family protein [Candidatus Bipolaricaulota bacterium]|nr:MAG: nitroreductase family protein [Candidatus Bipolaricaulota bacterium]